MTSLPQRLYHAAPQCAESAILADGLRAPAGLVFASPSQDDCLNIMCSRLMSHNHGITTIEFQGKTHPFPDIVRHDYMPVFEIDVSKTDAEKWSVSADHNASFFGDAEAWAYDGEVPAEALTLVGQFAPQEALETEGRVSAS